MLHLSIAGLGQSETSHGADSKSAPPSAGDIAQRWTDVSVRPLRDQNHIKIDPLLALPLGFRFLRNLRGWHYATTRQCASQKGTLAIFGAAQERDFELFLEGITFCL